MRIRRDQQSGHPDKDDPGKKRIERGEELCRIIGQRIDRPHAPQNHRGIQHRIDPREFAEHVISDHANPQRNRHDERNPKEVVEHAPAERARRERRTHLGLKTHNCWDVICHQNAVVSLAIRPPFLQRNIRLGAIDNDWPPKIPIPCVKWAMRSRYAIVVAFALVVLTMCLIGCGDSGKGNQIKVEPRATAAADGKLKVALLTVTDVNDGGWSAIGYEGLKAIEKELGAEISNQVTKDATIKDTMRSYAQDGYNLVIGHGFEYNAPEVELAPDFPNTVFVSTSGGETAANAGAFRFYLEQSFYLAGLIAGSQSKTGAVAVIGGPDVPSIRSTFKAFEAGAKQANPAIRVITKFTGKNDDVAAAKQATLQAIAEGADYLIHQTNSAVKGFFSACEEKNVWGFGANENQNDMSPRCLASAIIKAEGPFVELARQVQAGKYRGKIELVGMADQAVDFVVNPKNAGEITAEARALVDKVQTAMIVGDFKAPKDDF